MIFTFCTQNPLSRNLAKNGRGIFRSLASPSWALAGSLSDFGLSISPTLPEFDCSRLAALLLCAPLLVAHASGSTNSRRLLLEPAILVKSKKRQCPMSVPVSKDKFYTQHQSKLYTQPQLPTESNCIRTCQGTTASTPQKEKCSICMSPSGR